MTQLDSLDRMSARALRVDAISLAKSKARDLSERIDQFR